MKYTGRVYVEVIMTGNTKNQPCRDKLYLLGIEEAEFSLGRQ